MKKINNQVLNYFFNNLMFITNKSFYDNSNEIHSKTNKWILINSAVALIQFKKIISYLYLIKKRSQNNQKILFIINEDILPFFNDIKSERCYFASTIKESFDFLSKKNLYKTVSCIIYIGPEDDFHSLHFSVPFLGFTFQNYSYFDYQVSTYTYFHSTLLFLKACLVPLLK